MRGCKIPDAARSCTGSKRTVPLVKDLHPTTLFHVSINKDAVCREGLKTNRELHKEGKTYLPGIGGANDDFISFTTDESLAQDYAKDIVMLSKIANVIVTPSNIEEYVDKHDASPGMRTLPSAVFKEIEDGFKELGIGYSYEYTGVIDDLKKGIIRDKKTIYEHLKGRKYDDCVSFMKGKQTLFTVEDLCKDIEPIKDMPITFKEDVPGDKRRASVAERQNLLFELVRKHYFRQRQRNGGRQDPFFFGSTMENYRKIQPSDVGVFKVLAYMPKPIERYTDTFEYKAYGYVEEYYPAEPGDPVTPYGDKIRVSVAEKEIRMHPRYTTRLEEIPMRR